MDIAASLQLVAAAQTVFDLRPLAENGGTAAGIGRSVRRGDLASPDLAAARDNLMSLCGREIGRFAADQAVTYASFALAMRSRTLGQTRASRLTARLEAAHVAYARTIDGGDPDSLPAWKFLGLLHALDPILDAGFETQVLPPYRCCRDLTALRLTRRPSSGPVGAPHLLGLVAFAECFSVFRLDFAAFIRLLDRHGRPAARPWAAAAAPSVAPRPGLPVWGPAAGPTGIH